MPVLLALVLVVRYCGETRGRDLRDLELDPGYGAAAAALGATTRGARAGTSGSTPP